MTKEIYLNGMTADQLSEMIRESQRDELQQLRPAQPKTDTKYLTRHETARRLRISLVTLSDWVNRGKSRAHKIGGRVLFRDSDVEAALNRIIPTIQRKVQLEEQARLKEQEAAHLTDKANSIKKK